MLLSVCLKKFFVNSRHSSWESQISQSQKTHIMTQNQDSNVNHGSTSLCAVLYGETLSVAWHKGAQNTSCNQTRGFFFVLDPYTPVLRCYHMGDCVLNNKTNAGRKSSGSSALQSFLLLCSRFFFKYWKSCVLQSELIPECCVCMHYE